MDELIPLIYNELRQIARSKLRLERGGHTLNTAALVSEAHLKLVQIDRVQWQSRAHFFAIARGTGAARAGAEHVRRVRLR